MVILRGMKFSEEVVRQSMVEDLLTHCVTVIPDRLTMDPWWWVKI